MALTCRRNDSSSVIKKTNKNETKESRVERHSSSAVAAASVDKNKSQDDYKFLHMYGTYIRGLRNIYVTVAYITMKQRC